MTQQTASSQIHLKRVGMATLGTAIVAAIINSIVFLVADAAGVWDAYVIEIGAASFEVAVWYIGFGTLILVALSGLPFVVLIWHDAATGVQRWRLLAWVILVLSFLQPPLVADGDVAVILTLELLHVIAGGLAIFAIPRFGIA